MVSRDDAKPRAPISIASLASARIVARSSAVAGSRSAPRCPSRRPAAGNGGGRRPRRYRACRLQRIQVFGERLQFHGRPSVITTPECPRPGHHVDEHVVVFLAARCEADPRSCPSRPWSRRAPTTESSAPTRWPGRRSGVQVNEARGDQQTGRIDFPLGGIAVSEPTASMTPSRTATVADVTAHLPVRRRWCHCG